MLSIMLIRSGRTEYDCQGRIQGMLDVPLSEDGRREVEAGAAELLARPAELTAIYAGPCRCAQETTEILAERLKLARDASRPPLFQAMFIFQKPQALEEQGLGAFALGVPGAHLEVGPLQLESLPLTGQPAQFDLTLMMAEVGDELAATLNYSLDLFDAPTVDAMLGHLERLLAGLAA